jgi:hypothetical protein
VKKYEEGIIRIFGNMQLIQGEAFQGRTISRQHIAYLTIETPNKREKIRPTKKNINKNKQTNKTNKQNPSQWSNAYSVIDTSGP